MRFCMRAVPKQYVYLLAAGLSSFTLASTYAWVTPLLYYFKQPGTSIHLSTLETTWFTIIVDFSSALFSVPVCFLADAFGRKAVLSAIGPICAGSWLLVLFISQKWLLFAMRALQGVALAIGFSVLPVYLSEMADVNVRGGAVSFYCSLYQLGILYVYFIGLFYGFQGITWFTMAPNIIVTVLFFWSPESPYWYLMKNRKEDAFNALVEIRGGCRADSSIIEEIMRIDAAVQKDKELSKGIVRNILFSRKDRKSFLIVEGVTIITMLVGVNSIPINASDTVAILSGSVTFASYTTVILGLVLSLMTIPSILLADRWGRRKILLLTSAVTCISFTLGAVALYCIQTEASESTVVTALAYLCLLVGAAFNVFGVSTIQAVLVGEMFPTSSRSVTSGATYTVLTASSVVSLYLYSALEGIAGAYANFVVFAVFSFVGFIGFYTVLPETKGKTLDEIQDAL